MATVTRRRPASPRRKRYVVTHIDPKTGGRTETHVAAHSPADCSRVCGQYNIKPLSIRPYVRGEYIKVEPDAGWRVNALNLRTACQELGLQWPVVVKQISHKGSNQGKQGVRFDAHGKPYHLVRAKSYLTPERAGQVLWHELRHAAQSEALAEDVGALPNTREYREAHALAYNGRRPGRKRGTRYLNRPWEREARATEARNADLPLAKR